MNFLIGGDASLIYADLEVSVAYSRLEMELQDMFRE